MSWLLLNSVFSKIFSGLWDVCFGHYLATKNLNVAFCFLPSVPGASEFQACTEGKISCYWALNFYLLLSCFLLYLIFVSPPPPFFFSWAFTMLHFGRKSFHENQENCEIISQFTIYYLKGGRDGVEWSKTLIGIFCSTLRVFFLAFCRTCLTELCSFVYTCRWKDDSFTN